ncbi:elongation factor G [Desulfobaculum bizertense]|uniref:Elongation factor G n=1 Tax=Desulfobaculum bizertense DSM 18034 TaxID=1121442 RepID=A0A1T4VXS1_9BACT|nr:elongation factor G [Desulfobaculum bizertense]SKA69802.1 translation elongation factor 2 (EF-2/EF-G) [Desulfobaculum bizertense DSM 18034]
MSDALKNQRTYALVGHGGCGKTSVAEMLLLQTGAINRLGKIEEGNTALDTEPEEIKRRGSIQPAFAHYSWEKNPHFLIDTPGDNNFIGDLPYLLLASDAVLFTVDAVDGAKPLTKRLWQDVEKAQLPAMIFINKMDRDRANFDSAFDSLQSMLGIRPILLYMPIGEKEKFQGLVNVISKQAYFFQDDGSLKEGPVPGDMLDTVEIMQETMIENIAESDEDLMEKYLEEGELSLDDIRDGLRKGVLSRELVPVTCGSALNNQGGQVALDLIQKLFPSPLEHAAWQGEEQERESSPDAPVSAFILKTTVDPFSGQLALLRVLSGTLTSDTTLQNPQKDDKERIGALLSLVGKNQSPFEGTAGPGSIVAVAKLKEATTGDTLCDAKEPFRVTPPELPPTLMSYALAPEDKGDEDKAYAAVHKLLAEDVCLSLTRDQDTGDILISGMGQMHIETAIERAMRRGKTKIQLQTPKIPYRETFKMNADVQGRHKKQSGGRGQFGDCFIRVEPTPRGTGYEFLDEIVGGAIPRQYIPAVDKGIQEAAVRGVLAGYPVVDFKVHLYDGSYHSVDSSEMAFKIAGSVAFKKAAEEAKPVLLEPIVTVSVFVPDDFMGDVIGDLSSRRGKVLGSDSQGGLTEIKAHVPMEEVLQYAPDLRSMTGGQGTFTMSFDHYEEAPPQVTERVVAEAQ